MSEKTVVFEDGNAYEKMTGVWSQIVGKEFIEWLNTAGGLSWVDIGCGTGAFTAQIAKLCSPNQLLGIEPSEAQIEFACKRPMAQQVAFQSGDATALACESSSFDVATMALVLYFLPDPAFGMTEMKRVVKLEASSLLMTGMSQEAAYRMSGFTKSFVNEGSSILCLQPLRFQGWMNSKSFGMRRV